MQNNHNNEPNPSTSKKERTFWWIVLGLLAPPIGIAFYFQMKKERPDASRSVLLGTILGFGVIFLAVFILGIFLGTQAA